jgi:aminoglycoside/choline kinase family phosphotransferase
MAQQEAEQRKQALTHWTRQQLLVLWPQAELGRDCLRALSGDAGFRRYYRAEGAGIPHALLAVDAPPATEDSAQFVALANYLRSHGVRAPAILAVDIAQGFLLVEDFGDNLLQKSLQPDTATALYGEALITLLTLQQCPDDLQLIPRYDQALLRRELTLFSEWFVEQLLEHPLSVNEHALLERTFIQLERSALEQPQVLVHRDYHSRNLLVCESGALGVIDFQGALWGPCTYDVVSLLRDCYLRWPEEDVRRWALSYGNMAMDAGLLPVVDAATYLRWFDWMGLQRHIKVLGIFARLHLRDNKPHYLGDLSRVLGYVLDVSAGYQELAEFTDWFCTQILPLAAQQSWYVAADLPLGQTL